MSSITNQPEVPFRPLHNVLNGIEGMRKSGIIKGEVATRAANVLVSAPTEVAAVATNILFTPVQAAGVILGLGARVVAYISGIQAVKDFQQKMPTVTDFLRTVARIVAFSIGTSLSATVGVVSPKANFNAHVALGLIRNQKADEKARTLKIAQETLLQKRQEQIAQDLEEVEQLSHDDSSYGEQAIIDQVDFFAEEAVSSEEEVVAFEEEVVASEEEVVAFEEEVIASEEEVISSEEEIVSSEEEVVASEEEVASSEEEVVSSEEEVVAAKNETRFDQIKAKIIQAKDFSVAHKAPILAGTLGLVAVATAALYRDEIVEESQKRATFVGDYLANLKNTTTYAGSVILDNLSYAGNSIFSNTTIGEWLGYGALNATLIPGNIINQTVDVDPTVNGDIANITA